MDSVPALQTLTREISRRPWESRSESDENITEMNSSTDQSSQMAVQGPNLPVRHQPSVILNCPNVGSLEEYLRALGIAMNSSGPAHILPLSAQDSDQLSQISVQVTNPPVHLPASIEEFHPTNHLSENPADTSLQMGSTWDTFYAYFVRPFPCLSSQPNLGMQCLPVWSSSSGSNFMMNTEIFRTSGPAQMSTDWFAVLGTEKLGKLFLNLTAQTTTCLVAYYANWGPSSALLSVPLFYSIVGANTVGFLGSLLGVLLREKKPAAASNLQGIGAVSAAVAFLLVMSTFIPKKE